MYLRPDSRQGLSELNHFVPGSSVVRLSDTKKGTSSQSRSFSLTFNKKGPKSIPQLTD